MRPDITPQPSWIISLIEADVTPFAYLEIGRAMIEQFQHMPDVLCVLNHEVQFHVEFAAYQLQSETNRLDRFLCLKNYALEVGQCSIRKSFQMFSFDFCNSCMEKKLYKHKQSRTCFFFLNFRSKSLSKIKRCGRKNKPNDLCNFVISFVFQLYKMIYLISKLPAVAVYLL